MKKEFAEKNRFLYLKENIGILDLMVHSKGNFETIILKEGTKISDNIEDKVLTAEIKALKEAVERFEENTGLTIKVV